VAGTVVSSIKVRTDLSKTLRSTILDTSINTNTLYYDKMKILNNELNSKYKSINYNIKEMIK